MYGGPWKMTPLTIEAPMIANGEVRMMNAINVAIVHCRITRSTGFFKRSSLNQCQLIRPKFGPPACAETIRVVNTV